MCVSPGRGAEDVGIHAEGFIKKPRRERRGAEMRCNLDTKALRHMSTTVVWDVSFHVFTLRIWVNVPRLPPLAIDRPTEEP